MPVKRVDLDRDGAAGGYFKSKEEALVSARRRVQSTGRARVILFDTQGSPDCPWHHMALMEKYGVGRDHPDFVESVYYNPGK